MEIEIKTSKTVYPKTLKIHMKVCDQFCAALVDESGEEICKQTNDYVPSFMPGNHYGDYLILDVDIKTGQITNWKVDGEDVATWIDKCNGGEE